MISIAIAGFVAALVSLLGTPWLIKLLRRKSVGQQVRDDGPTTHYQKAGTPTMGGTVIVLAIVLGYAAPRLRTDQTVTTRSGLAVVFIGILGAGIIGFIDDYLKVRNRRSLGLNKTLKLSMLLAVGALFTGVLLKTAEPATVLSVVRSTGWHLDLGDLGWVVLAMLMFVATTNAVNLTDGLDGLAGGSSGLVFVGYALIGFWQFLHRDVYQVAHALDLAIVAAACAGACGGFLWWNAAPAKIFMGDCGALAIGGGLAGLALTTNTALLLPVVGALYVVETMSVIIQVISFRVFHKRVFRMSPIHHHFELKGWPETTVIIRFWILVALSVAVGLGVFYADYRNVASQLLTSTAQIRPVETLGVLL